jgi:3-phosphoshikimate 1-carboxyvinyltransferase
MTRLLPGPLLGVEAAVRVPTSKSLTNRALIASAAADGGCIQRPLDCDDTRLLARALDQAGWPVAWGEKIVVGPRKPVPEAEVNLGNSGTGARLILGLLACAEGRFRVDGTHRLRERPMLPLVDALVALGSEISSSGGFLPVELVGGRLAGGRLQLRPEISSQFVSSLLLAGPLMENGLELEVIGPVPSRPYLDLTRDVMVDFGASISRDASDRWKVAPGGLRPTTYVVEGDWSAMAFAAAAVAVVGGSVTIGPLSSTSSQGDRAICELLESAGLELGFSGEELEISGRMTRPFEANLTATPDLFPALAVAAAAGPTGSVLAGIEHLKHKESDRLTVMMDNLGRLGAVFDLGPTALVVRKGIERNHSGVIRVTAADDHRVAMAMAVAALAAGELELDDGSCVGKSFPGFWKMWDTLVDGGRRRG